MPLHIEDLKVGEFVAVVGVSQQTDNYLEREHFTFQMMNVLPRDNSQRFDGEPLEILAISVPFLCVKDSKGRRHGIDTRDLILTRLSKDFVSEMLFFGNTLDGKNVPRSERQRRKREERERRREHKKRREEAKKDPKICPRCFNPRMSQLRRGDGTWVLHCDQCRSDYPTGPDNSGGPVIR